MTPRQRAETRQGLPTAGLALRERQALASFLQSPALGGRAMDLHMIQGLAAGLCLGPRLISPALWLPWVWDRDHGVQPPAVSDLEQFNAVLGWVMSLYNEAAEQLGPTAAEGGSSYVPLFADRTEASKPAVANYCAGLQRAVTLAGDDWAPLQAEWPQWLELIASPAPEPEAVLAMLEPMRRYWRGRTDRLEPLRSLDIIGQLRDAFEFFSRPFPSEAVALAERHREVVAPWLVQVLDEVARDPSQTLQDDYVLHDFAMVLLGHWRDTRAYQPLLALARLPYDTVEAILGDLLFETYTRALASVYNGELAPLVAIVEDDSAHVWVRTALIDAWTLLVIEGDAALETLEDCLLAIGKRDAAKRRGEPRPSGDPTLIEAIVHAAADIASTRLRGPVLAWFDDALIDPRHIGRAEFEREIEMPLDSRRNELRLRGRSYLRDPQAEIGWWAGYHEDPERTAQRTTSVAGTVVRNTPKVGRNDPCPCGSGRKYKNCHGAT